jgi:hypothetical protein
MFGYVSCNVDMKQLSASQTVVKHRMNREPIVVPVSCRDGCRSTIAVFFHEFVHCVNDIASVRTDHVVVCLITYKVKVHWPVACRLDHRDL